jgi:hypothetical protein
LEAAACHSLKLCCGRLHFREDVERLSSCGVVAGSKKGE